MMLDLFQVKYYAFILPILPILLGMKREALVGFFLACNIVVLDFILLDPYQPFYEWVIFFEVLNILIYMLLQETWRIKLLVVASVTSIVFNVWIYFNESFYEALENTYSILSYNYINIYLLEVTAFCLWYKRKNPSQA